MRIGNDIVRIQRVEHAIRSASFLARVFTPREQEYCGKRAESYAGLFAAKEAYLKALGCGIDRELTAVEIAHDASGKPYIVNAENCDVSVSHDGEYAIATVIVW